jgi:hypothetical protein
LLAPWFQVHNIPPNRGVVKLLSLFAALPILPLGNLLVVMDAMTRLNALT